MLLAAGVSGRVVDAETGNPVAFAGVKDAASGAGTMADQDGFFYLKDLEPGQHTIVFSQLGYAPETVVVQLSSGQNREIYPSLSPKAIIAEEIVVTGARQEFEQEVKPSAVRLDADAIRTMPTFLESDIMRTLQALPGVAPPNDFTTGLYVRGSSPSQNLILVDGAPVLNPSHMGGLFSTFSTDALEGLEFWMGGFPAKFGGRMSSVLSVETKAGDTSAYHGVFNVSMLASSAVIEGPGPAGSSFCISARRTYFDKILPLFVKDFNFPYYFYDIQSKVKLPINTRSWLSYSYFYSGDVLNFSMPDAFYTLKMPWGNAVNSIKYTYLHSSQTFSSLSVYQSYFKMDMSEGSGDPDAEPYDVFHNAVTEKGGQYSLNWSKQDQSLEFGLEFRETDYAYHYSMASFVFDVRKIPWRVGSYITYKTKLGKMLVNPGLRVDYYKGFADFLRFDPRIGLKYFINPNLAWIASGGVFHQYDVVANQQEDVLPFAYFWLPVLPGQVPSRSYHAITGFEQWLGEAFTFKTEIYYKKISVDYDYKYAYDLSESDQQNDFAFTPGYSTGIDVLLKKDTGPVSGWIGYSYTYAQRHQDSVGWYFPSYEKRHSANLFLTYKMGRWEFGSRFNLSSGTPYTGRLGRYRLIYWDDQGNPRYAWRTVWGKKNALRYPMYHKLDLFTNLNFHLWHLPISLQLSAVNIYNHSNVFFYYMDYSEEPPVRNVINQMPRFFSVGIRSQF